MKLKLLIIAAFAASFFSCQSASEKQADVLEAEVKSHINDFAFKRNGKANVLELKLLKVDTLPESFLDTMVLEKYIVKMREFNQDTKELLADMREQLDNVRSFAILGKSYVQKYRDKMAEDEAAIKLKGDSLRHYAQLDSLKRLEMKSRPKKGSILKGGFYLKAQFKENNSPKTENYLDTTYYLFRTDGKMIKD